MNQIESLKDKLKEIIAEHDGGKFPDQKYTVDKLEKVLQFEVINAVEAALRKDSELVKVMRENCPKGEEELYIRHITHPSYFISGKLEYLNELGPEQ